MSKRKIVVCADKNEAATQHELLKKDGYTIKVAAKRCSVIIWDATHAGGTGDIRSNAWLVEGEQ